MSLPRVLLAFMLSVTLCSYTIPAYAGPKPVGILTTAYDAYLNEAEAFGGVSVFEGEILSTDPDGKMGVQMGAGKIALGGSTRATLHPTGTGAHVDMSGGSIFFASREKGEVEIHVAEGLVRPMSGQLTRGEVTLLGPKILQITARTGDLAFSYHEEFQVLPEGETYRIYLDAAAEPQGPAGAGSAGSSTGPPLKAGHAKKVAYFIGAGAAAGLTAWGIYELIQSNNATVSPAKP
jgi:hypothetical protein